uniref:Uncharacterized protein n=1 Tax=Rhizobium rhizogenes TaxID=359 RepID=A0A4P8DJS3_RHIRH|nr:hypothetical protein pOC-C5.8_577 [Rhizobium rhizogenes]
MTGRGCGLCHDGFLFGLSEAFDPLAVLSFGAVERNRRKPGGSGSGQA